MKGTAHAINNSYDSNLQGGRPPMQFAAEKHVQTAWKKGHATNVGSLDTQPRAKNNIYMFLNRNYCHYYT